MNRGRPHHWPAGRLERAGRRALALALAGLLGLPGMAELVSVHRLAAQDASASIPEAADPLGIRSPADFLEYDLGQRFTGSGEILRYFRHLADRSERVVVREYGRTPELRPLIQAIITSPENHARLESILVANAELTEPGTGVERAAEVAAANPAIVHLTYGVHGDESSSPEAAMWTAWDLVSGQGPLDGVLDSLVVVMDPVANPDGRERYVQWYRSVRGTNPDPDPMSWEHRPPWPGGRYNHYLFDLNRDWAWATQPETRARLRTWSRWNPQVHVDFHEMDDESTYFFFPPTAPINPIYPAHVLEWGRRFGEANSAEFDRNGWLYFTGDTYDLFYPGYGDSWPSLLGAVGMTYEQAGGPSAGLAVRRDDGTVLTLRDRILHHRTAARATLLEAASGKADLIEGFAATHRAVDEGHADILLVPLPEFGDDRLAELARFLQSMEIVVEEASAPFEARAQPHPGFVSRDEFPQGTLLVRARQPRGRLATVLLRPDNALGSGETYDITAWSLPYAYGVEAHSVEAVPEGPWEERLEVEAAPPAEVPAIGYLVQPGLQGIPPLFRFLEAGGRAVVLEAPITIEGTRHPRGTVFLSRSANPDLEARLRSADLFGSAIPVATSRATEGPDLGADGGLRVAMPSIALLGGTGSDPTSFGAHWFLLERLLGVPFDILRIDEVTATSLESYDTLLIPGEQGLGEALGPGGQEAVQHWVEGGGTVVAVDGGARFVARELADIEVLDRDAASPSEPAQEIDPSGQVRSERERQEDEARIQGAILPARADTDHPLTVGALVAAEGGDLFVLSNGWAFRASPSHESPVWFPDGLRQVSGRASVGRLDDLARGSWVVHAEHGRGAYILFAGDPLFRLFWHTGIILYANALLVASAS